MKNKNTRKPVKEEKLKSLNKWSVVICFKWLSLLLVIFMYFFVSEFKIHSSAFVKTLAVYAFYLLITTSLVMKNTEDNRKLSLILFLTTYIDIVSVCTFSYQLGGTGSDIYILLFFIIGYCSLYGNISSAYRLGMLCIILYSASSFLADKAGIGILNPWKLLIRDFLLIAASFSVSLVCYEMKKYNEMHKKEFKRARTDKLTGLSNRHHFEQKLKEEEEYAQRTGNPINVLIFDLDNFKSFNDTYGHIWGDKLLTLFSGIIRQNTRNDDVAVRYGGEEFLIFIRDLDIETAKGVAERIRKNLEMQRVYIADDENRRIVTVSCGVAQYPIHSKRLKDAIECADKALYRAKEIGKNTVVSYEEIKHYV
ncbi:MAG: GGDEF domain-containing protein [Clostridia bacterium]|nr:GGDEF domain-containing protein [Clostridia bacterium]